MHSHFGLVNVWTEGDLVTRGVFLLLAGMSLASWGVIALKALDQRRCARQAKAVEKFWTAPEFASGLGALGAEEDNPFRTLALEQQASEVWQVLGAVKTEFERYGEWVARIREQVHKAADTLDKADTRTKQMRRARKVVEALPEAQAQALLPPAEDSGDDGS